MSGRQRRHATTVLLIVTAVIWLHEWFPAMCLAAFILWAVVHHRLEGGPSDVLHRWWRHAWPPRTLVLVPMLVAGTAVYGLSGVPLKVKILPVALIVVAWSLIVLSGWWRRPAHRGGHHTHG